MVKTLSEIRYKLLFIALLLIVQQNSLSAYLASEPSEEFW